MFPAGFQMESESVMADLGVLPLSLFTLFEGVCRGVCEGACIPTLPLIRANKQENKLV